MGHEVETQRCSLGHEHVVLDRIRCDHCKGVIAELRPKTVNWFGKGVATIHEPVNRGEEQRDIVEVTFTPATSPSTMLHFTFCTLSCALSYFRDPPEHITGADRFEIRGTVRSFSQQPLGRK